MAVRSAIDASAGPGADDWAPWIRRLPSAPDDWPPPGRLVVVAPHPDDEMLGAGATMALASDRGDEVRVVAVTAGEAAFPDAGPAERAELASRRRRETVAAHAAAGVRVTRVEVGIPDGRVASHRRRLADALTSALDPAAAVTCLAPWPHDGHPDHDTCGEVAAAVASRQGVPLWWYPVWAWNVHAPGPGAAPMRGAHRVDLPPGLAARRGAGIDAYESQIRPWRGRPAVVPPRFLAHFRRPWEVWIPADTTTTRRGGRP